MRHLDAVYHVRGESQYVDDIPEPIGMLHVVVFSSPVAHGKIVGLDIEKARQTQGVVAVLTARDVPGENQIGTIILDEPLLAHGEVHCVGQPVALVVAESTSIARLAARQILLEIEEMPAITDARQAFAAGKIIGNPRTFAMGDVNAAWQECDVIVEGRCDSAGQEHLYLETQRARAIPLEANNIHVYSSTQGPYVVQKIVARVLGLPLHAVEVEVKRIGGGFGGKEDQANAWGAMAALAAWCTKRPAQLVLSRIDDIKMTGKRHPYSVDFKIGAKKDGKILAYEAKFYQNAGCSADLSLPVLERTLFHSTNAYFIPNTRVTAVSCRTNLPSNTAFRGFGGPQGMFAIECAIARLSDKLGMRREDVQHKNLIEENDMFHYGQKAQRSHARQTWEKAVELYDLEEMRRRIEAYNQKNFATKKGYALMPICFGISFTTHFLNQGSALVHVYTDGSVGITTGGVEMGQGLSSNLIGIASKAFGIQVSRIKIESTNTTRVANSSPTAASASTHLYGNAMVLAIQQILERIKNLVAKDIGVEDITKITIQDEKVSYDGHDTPWNWTNLVQKAYFSRVSLSANGFYATPEIWFDKSKEKGHPFAYHVYGTAIIEVTLDCILGTYDIDAVKIVHDLGRSINPVVDRGQIEGGVAQGLGWMTIEDLQFNTRGQYLSNNMATYKAPDLNFMPENLVVNFIEDAEPSGPYGSKAVGEPPLMYGIGVFFALRHAMRAFHANLDSNMCAPLTPERILLTLEGV